MLPISTPQQHALRNSLNTFLPKDVITIIDSYFAFSDATEVLILGSDCKPLNSELNRTTTDSIKQALCSPHCDREIIRLIFKNAGDNGYLAALNEMMNDLRLNRKNINLDNADFSGLTLWKMNFNSASMRNVNFTGANVDDCFFIASDLTGTQGLTGAAKQITVNCQTIFTGSEIASHGEKLSSVLGNKPCRLVLSGPGQEINYLGMTLGDT